MVRVAAACQAGYCWSLLIVYVPGPVPGAGVEAIAARISVTGEPARSIYHKKQVLSISQSSQ